MARGNLSNENWAKLAPLLPPEHSGEKGRPLSPHRPAINAILWRIRTGAPWRDLPESYPPWQTCYDRFNYLKRQGIWLKILQTLQAQKDAQGELDWHTACADGSVIRAHQHAAGASAASSATALSTLDKVTPPIETPLPSSQKEQEPEKPKLLPIKERIEAVQALGYSQGGFSTKIHLVCDGAGRPLCVTLSPGQAHESKHLAASLDAIRVPRIGRGRPKKRPERLLCDRAYNGSPARTVLRVRRIGALIPTKHKERMRRKRAGQKGGRPYYFDKERYKRRNVVERCFNRLKQWRAVATRYDKLAENYLTTLTIAMIMCWLD